MKHLKNVNGIKNKPVLKIQGYVMFALNSCRMEKKDKIQSTKNTQNWYKCRKSEQMLTSKYQQNIPKIEELNMHTETEI